MSRAERYAQIVALKQTMTFREIAAHLGLAMSTITDVYYDPSGDGARKRKRRRHGTCADCGADTFNGGSEPPKRCQTCQLGPLTARIADEARAAAEAMLALRRQGLANIEIAAELGIHHKSVSRSLKRLRDQGVDVPLAPHYVTTHSPSPAGRVSAS